MTPDMAAVAIRVGTAGWSYEDWKGIVYPTRPPRGFDRLGAMASLFDANEINSTFYRIPDARQTADWARRVAHNPRFAFTAKLYRGFTHERGSGLEEEKAFLAAMEPLRREERLGCVLVQFPFSFHNTVESHRVLEDTLRRFASLPLAVEFRHDSWDRDDVGRLLSGHDAAFVNIDQPRLRGNLGPTNRVTAPLAYYRFHGRNAPMWFGPDSSNEERYNYLYRDEELEPWVEQIREGTRRVGRASARGGVFVILNNHFRGQAVANALELQHALTGRRVRVPAFLGDAYPALTPIAEIADGPAQPSLFGSKPMKKG